MKAAENYIHFDNGKLSVGYTIQIKEVDGWFRGDIPAFDITDFSKTYKEAHEGAEASVRSYLHFWLDIRGWDSFREELKKNGFSISNPDIHSGKVEAIYHKRYLQAEPDVMVVNEQKVIYGQGARD